MNTVDKGVLAMKKMTPMRAIRARCRDCCAQQPAEVRKCLVETCALWPYRMGHRPDGSTTAPDGVAGKKRTLDRDFQEGGAS